jgi:hypothetical protein
LFNSYTQLGFKKATSGAEYFYQQANSNFPSTPTLDYFAGRTVTIGMAVSNPGGCTGWQLDINDGSEHLSPTITATSATWAEFTYTMSATPTAAIFGVKFSGAANCVFYIAKPMLVNGARIGGVANWMPIQNETVRSLVSIVPYLWSGNTSTVTFPVTLSSDGSSYAFEFYPYLETQGIIEEDVAAINMNFEGSCRIPTSTTIIGSNVNFKSNQTAPSTYSTLAKCPIASGVFSWPGSFQFDRTGIGWVSSSIPGDIWSGVAIDIKSVLVN